ncbi:hypothetical protein E4K66_24135 [Bradyrhizobium frederickii]|uniref:Uncharacterized protein n=1 Tax=Bradyrhizobium frederickii TaxID=2560054 RepID=A0A4Y9L0R6_9BRAD|nr:hypothetical protein [Bradyrhizobium frederickii]TFV36386.1 hypothetical protein E4K66_24135 [Bradyrhizobium frederickii]
MKAIALSTTTGRSQFGENPEVASAAGSTTPIFAVESEAGTGLVEIIVILPNPSTQYSLPEQPCYRSKSLLKQGEGKVNLTPQACIVAHPAPADMLIFATR